MDKDRKRFRLEVLLERYFLNFPRILLTNLLFAVPSAAAFALVYFISNAVSGGMNIFILALAIILISPFFAGVTETCRNIARGDENVSVIGSYFNGIKNNFLPFLLYGVIAYVYVVLSYLSISMYIKALQISWIFYALLFIVIIIELFLLYTLFYVPLMTVTFDIKLRYIYKNSFLMSFGEFKNNLFATFGLIVVAAILFTVTIVCRTELALILLLAGLWALLVPATCSIIVNFFIYDGMYNLIVNKFERKREIEEAIKNGGKAPEPKPADPLEDFSDIDISTLKDTDDYIFHNGKMVKQSTILRLIRERQEKEDKHE